MTETQINIDKDETQENAHSTEELFNELLTHEPKPIANFVPENAAEQKRLFLSGEVRIPAHNYAKLDAVDFNAMRNAINTSTELIGGTVQDDPVLATVYEEFGARYLKTVQFMELAAAINHEEDPVRKQELSDSYMQLNIELYGEPKESVYRSFMNDALNNLRTKNLTGRAAEVYDELLELVPRSVAEFDAGRFRPSPETIEWAGAVVEALHGDLLSHIPEDQEVFSDAEVRDIFQEIIDIEFLDIESGINAAEGWTVVIEKAQSINVRAAEKKVVIPEGRELSRSTLRGLVVHEIGIHMLRSVMGEQTTLGPLRMGLSGYYDSEEGLGTVAEQALTGKYREVGEGHYITAGLAYFDQKDFREIFEIKWRLSALKKVKDGVELTEEMIDASRSFAHGSTMRSFRGTDELPWFKDLAYYNGANSVWRYLEEHRGDDLHLSLLLAGKADPSDDSHRRTILESVSKQ